MQTRREAVILMTAIPLLLTDAVAHKWLSKKCGPLSKKVEFGQTFVQKLLVES